MYLLFQKSYDQRPHSLVLNFFLIGLMRKKSLSTIQMIHYITHKFSDLYLNLDKQWFENRIFAFNSLGLFELRAQVLHKSKTFLSL